MLAGKYSPDRVFQILKLIALIPLIDIFSFGFLRKGYVQMSGIGSIGLDTSYVLKVFPLLVALSSFYFIDDLQIIVIFLNGIITYFYLRLYYYRIASGGDEISVGINLLLKRRIFNIILLLLIPYSIYFQVVIVILVFVFYYMQLSKIPVEKSMSNGVVNLKFWQSDILQSLNNSMIGLLYDRNLISGSNFFALRLWTSSSQVTRAMAELKLKSKPDIKELWKEVFIVTPFLLMGLTLFSDTIGGAVSFFFSDLRVDLRPYVVPIGLLYFYDAYRHIILTDLQRYQHKIVFQLTLEVIAVLITVVCAFLFGHNILFVYALMCLALLVVIIKSFNGKY